MAYDTTILKESFENAKYDNKWFSTFWGEAERCFRTLIPTASQTSKMYDLAAELFDGSYNFDDLIQDCLIKLVEANDRGYLNHATDHLDRFIVQCAAWVLHDYVEKQLRRKKIVRHEPISEEAENSPYFDNFDDEEILTEAAEQYKAYTPGEKKEGEKVIQLEKKSYKKIAEFSSISEAAKATGISRSNISEMLSGKRKTAGGFLWVKSSNPLIGLLK